MATNMRRTSAAKSVLASLELPYAAIDSLRMVHGEDGGLTAACRNKHPGQPGLCFMSPHMQDAVSTPFFVFNSKYDSWQLGNELQTTYGPGSPEVQQAAVLQYGEDFMNQFAPVRKDAKNGAFITSCICHGCPWGNASALSIDEKSVYQHFAAWMAGETTGEASIHIDTRGPNGDGAIHNAHCNPFGGNA